MLAIGVSAADSYKSAKWTCYNGQSTGVYGQCIPASLISATAETFCSGKCDYAGTKCGVSSLSLDVLCSTPQATVTPVVQTTATATVTPQGALPVWYMTEGKRLEIRQNDDGDYNIPETYIFKVISITANTANLEVTWRLHPNTNQNPLPEPTSSHTASYTNVKTGDTIYENGQHSSLIIPVSTVQDGEIGIKANGQDRLIKLNYQVTRTRLEVGGLLTLGDKQLTLQSIKDGAAYYDLSKDGARVDYFSHTKDNVYLESYEYVKTLSVESGAVVILAGGDASTTCPVAPVKPVCVTGATLKSSTDEKGCTRYECVKVSCAKEGEKYSKVYTNDYPTQCCEGLTEWDSGFDTRKVVDGQCVSTGLVAGNPVGTCIKAGDGVCSSIETVCNSPKDCMATTQSIKLSTDKTMYKPGETVQITAYNNGNTAVGYSLCGVPYNVYDDNGNTLLLQEPGAPVCTAYMQLEPGEKTSFKWDQTYFVPAKCTASKCLGGYARTEAPFGKYTIKFGGAETQVILLRQNVVCPTLAPPSPEYCADGTLNVVTDENGCQSYTCDNDAPPQPPESEKFTQTITLYKGWNLIGTMLDNIESAIANCEAPLAVWGYANGAYYKTTPEGMRQMQGYWIKSTSDCKLELSGPTPSFDTPFKLSAGWNLLSLSTQFQATSDCQATAGPWAYNTQAGKYDKAVNAQDGQGYWIKVANACTLSPRDSNQPPALPVEVEQITTTSSNGGSSSQSQTAVASAIQQIVGAITNNAG